MLCFILNIPHFSFCSFQIIITTLQLIQMVVGCWINIWAYNFLNSTPSSSLDNGQPFCHISKLNIKLSIAMYFSYFVLFSRFFYKNYINRGYNVKEHSNNYEIHDKNQSSGLKSNVSGIGKDTYKRKIH